MSTRRVRAHRVHWRVPDPHRVAPGASDRPTRIDRPSLAQWDGRLGGDPLTPVTND